MSHSNTPPVRNLAPLTARSSNLRGVSGAEHQTAEQYSKTGRTKPRKHLPRSALSWNTRQDFLKIHPGISICQLIIGKFWSPVNMIFGIGFPIFISFVLNSFKGLLNFSVGQSGGRYTHINNDNIAFFHVYELVLNIWVRFCNQLFCINCFGRFEAGYFTPMFST